MLKMALLSLLSFSTSYLSTSTVVALCVFFTLLCACIIIGHLLEENRWANESITALLLGLCSGVVVLLVTKFQSTKILTFSEDLFFLYLLPPIIFNAGFQVKKKQFFKNFTTILLFGVLGTVISFCLISAGAFLLMTRIGIADLGIKDHLAIGAILSATDSVCTLQVLSQDETPLLYSIVFGEGVVNDAMSIVLFNSVQSLDFSTINAITALKLLGTFLYLFCTSTALGIGVGLLSAYIIKTLYFGRHSTDREVALMMLMAYLTYMIAETLQDCKDASSSLLQGDAQKSENLPQINEAAKECIKKLNVEFQTNMSDDLTPAILNGALQEALKFVNSSVKMLKATYLEQEKMQKRAQLQLVQSLLEVEKEVRKVLNVLGFLSSASYFEVLQQLKDKALIRAGLVEDEVLHLIEERSQAKKNKDFPKSDKIRIDLAAKGIALLDVGNETIWRPCIPITKSRT